MMELVLVNLYFSIIGDLRLCWCQVPKIMFKGRERRWLEIAFELEQAMPWSYLADRPAQ